MVLIRAIGALAFVLGVALLALDASRSMQLSDFQATSLEQLWINLGVEGSFSLRFHLVNLIGDAAQQVLELPAAFVAFGLGMGLLLVADGGTRSIIKKPLTF